MDFVTIWKIVVDPEVDSKPRILENYIGKTDPIPEGWTTDYNSLKNQLPPEPVDPSQVLQAKMMAQIAALNKQVAELTGGAQ